MRIERIERLVITFEEARTLDDLYSKLNNLETEDYNINNTRANLLEAISDFLDVCSDKLD